LSGTLLSATGFKRRDGVLFLVVVLPDGSPGTIPADATDVLGGTSIDEAVAVVLSAEGARRLRALVDAFPSGRRSRGGRRKGK
jgi:hypothetical protein